uniref:Uncharacterized protein n=1 Tax=Arundo donax TaxID=35708 RepID=A0A0A9AZD0_ARUDO
MKASGYFLFAFHD